MRSRPYRKNFILPLLAFLVISCGMTEQKTASPSTVNSPKPTLNSSSQSIPSGLFIATDEILELPPKPHISRFRFVKIDIPMLLDENGEPRDLEKVTINLFADAVYTGIITQIDHSGGVISWVGYLEGIEYSEMTMLITADTFIGHFASPMGVYEATYVQGTLYRVIQIDQSKFQGGEG